MRVVMLSDYETAGGAAIAASRLAEGISQEDTEVIRIVGQADSDNHPWATIILQLPSQWRVLSDAVTRISTPLGRSIRASLVGQRLREVLENIDPDVISIHNLHGAGWGPELVGICAEFGPVVWTLHDMWSFTGRCAYSYDCRKFVEGCNATCPTPREYPALEPRSIARAWRHRRGLLGKYPHLVAVCPSRWLAREASAGIWAGNDVRVIRYGLPLSVYCPLDPEIARAALGISKPGPVLLIAAQNLLERRKGANILVEAVRRVQDRPVTIITLGYGRLPLESDGLNVCPLGYVESERIKMLAYNAADLLVHAARVDNFPNTVIEAIACGTPVVGFPVGGMAELVQPARTGWLATEVSPNGLAETIETALKDIHAGVDLGPSCRDIAKSEYALEIQAQRYLSLFQNLDHEIT